MKFYVGHSSSFDYVKELYEPIKASQFFTDHDVTLCHDKTGGPEHSKQMILESDWFVADVSYPSTGLGVELGWADDAGVQVACIHKAGTTPSSSINLICEHVFEYADSDELIQILERLAK